MSLTNFSTRSFCLTFRIAKSWRQSKSSIEKNFTSQARSRSAFLAVQFNRGPSSSSRFVPEQGLFDHARIQGLINRFSTNRSSLSIFDGDSRSYEVDFASLEAFKKLHGHLVVPQRFSFDGWEQEITEQGKDPKLGQLGFAASYLGMHVKMLRRLNSQGQVDSSRKKLTKNSAVHAILKDSTAPTPRQGKAMKKKQQQEQLKLSRSDIKRLSAMGFVWSVHQYKFDRFLRAMRRYKALFGDALVPIDFVVPAPTSHPHSSNMPNMHTPNRSSDAIATAVGTSTGTCSVATSQYGTMEGARVTTKQSRRSLSAQKKDILENAILLQSSGKVNGNLCPRNSSRRRKKIAEEELVDSRLDPQLWDADLWGLKLGAMAGHCRRGSVFASKRSLLISKGVLVDSIFEQRFKDLVEAVTIFHQLKREKQQKEDLQHRQRQRRQRAEHSEQDSDLVNSTGPSDSSSSTADSQAELKLDLPALLSYAHARIPRSFAIPENDPRWPRHLWGLKLGYKIHNVKYRNAFQDYYNDE